jgi:apolipoprotein N-acyltransferase
MSAIQSWIDRDDAKRAEELKTKPTRWFVYRIIFGLLIVAKAAHLALITSSPWGYGLAALLTAGGLVWIVEGAQGFRARPSAEEPVPGPIR